MTHVQAISCPHSLEHWLRRFIQHRAWSAILSVSLHVLVFAVLAMVAQQAAKSFTPATEIVYVRDAVNNSERTSTTRTQSSPPTPTATTMQNNNREQTQKAMSSSKNAALNTGLLAANKTLDTPLDLPSFHVASAPFTAPQAGLENIIPRHPYNHATLPPSVCFPGAVRDFTGGWVKDDSTPIGLVGNNRKQLKAQFTVFKAKYQDGDWNCNPADVENLLLQIKRWSEGRIDAQLHPEVLDIGTDRIFEIKPPFVYLTGHKNFQLLDREVHTLRDYLLVGGAIWADSALVGRHSRFDLAFRREIAKVLPGRDFEAVPPDHDLFHAFFDKTQLPSGMNGYRETAEIINIGNHLAVLYTLNGYGHLWESRLNSTGDIERSLVNVGTLGRPAWAHVYGPHLGNGILYRNVNDASVRDAYKFGINVVVHLLTRYQDALRFLPKELPPLPESLRSRLEPKSAPADGLN